MSRTEDGSVRSASIRSSAVSRPWIPVHLDFGRVRWIASPCTSIRLGRSSASLASLGSSLAKRAASWLSSASAEMRRITRSRSSCAARGLASAGESVATAISGSRTEQGQSPTSDAQTPIESSDTPGAENTIVVTAPKLGPDVTDIPSPGGKLSTFGRALLSIVGTEGDVRRHLIKYYAQSVGGGL